MMQKIILVTSILIHFCGLSQNIDWVKYCNEKENQSNSEYCQCLEKGAVKTNQQFELVYKSLQKKLADKIKAVDNKSVQYEILKIYVIQLPVLYESMKGYAKAISEIDTATEIDGSGYVGFKNERLIKQIKENIKVLENIEIPDFN